MKNYDEIDPELYDKRYVLIPRERYLYKHWIPLLEKAIRVYCKNNLVGLDLGCGTGSFFIPLLKKEVNDVIGMDISLRFLKQGKKRNKNLNLVQGNAYKIPLKNESIDVVISNLFEYIDRNIATKEIHRILKKGGKCIVLTPNKYSEFALTYKIIMKLKEEKWAKNETSKRELFTVFRNNGFELLEFQINDGLVWLPEFLDRLFGEKVYKLVENVFKPFGGFPFSNVMLFVVRKK